MSRLELYVKWNALPDANLLVEKALEERGIQWHRIAECGNPDECHVVAYVWKAHQSGDTIKPLEERRYGLVGTFDGHVEYKEALGKTEAFVAYSELEAEVLNYFGRDHPEKSFSVLSVGHDQHGPVSVEETTVYR
jgi:hypothetical protein